MIIGGVTLDNDLVWEDEFQNASGAGTAERTIYGTLSVQSFALEGGRPMTLVGDANRGWQSRDTVVALQALANVAGNQISVTLPDSRQFTAEFRSEDQPVVSFAPITWASAPDSDFWYYGSVKLRIID